MMSFTDTGTGTTETIGKILRTPSVAYSATSTASSAGLNSISNTMATAASTHNENPDLPARLNPQLKLRRTLTLRRQDSLSKSHSGSMLLLPSSDNNNSNHHPHFTPNLSHSHSNSNNQINSNNNNNNNHNNPRRLERGRTRRMAQVNQDIKIIEITRSTRTATIEKKKIPPKNEIFKFDCEGDIVTPQQGIKKHVKWHATFDKPIEQLIYPSLQRFDNDTYEEKRKVFKQLHGGMMDTSSLKAPNSTPKVAASPSPKPTKASAGGSSTVTGTGMKSPPKSPEQPVYSFSESHGIKLDILPDAMNLPNDFMFIHTPKWTVEITDAKSPPKTAEDNRKTHQSSPLVSPKPRKSLSSKSTVLKKILKTRKKNKNKNKNKKKKQANNLSRIIMSEDDQTRSMEDDDFEGDDNNDDDDDSDTFSMSSHEFESDKRSLSSRTEHRSLMEEIEMEGEKYLRQKIKDRYEAKLVEDRHKEMENQEASNPLYELKKSIMKKDKLPALVLTPADGLYAQLVDRHKPGNSGGSTSTNAMTPAAKLHKLTELTSEEIAFNEQSKIVKKLVPAESEYLMDGVLYYRIRNQLHNTHLQELQAIEQRKMTVPQKKLSRRYSNHFSQRLSARKSEIHAQQASVSEMHLNQHEDPHMVKATDIQYLDDLQELQLHRFNRAVQNKFNGFTGEENQNLLKQLSTGKIEITREGVNGSPSSPKQQQKSSFLSKFAPQRSNSQKDHLYRETEALLIAETNKRKAQDLLLLNQLEAGVLPETFIKPSEDPRFITINLSQYGIGDVRGLCLGKCLKALDRLQSIGLTDNRLTSISLPTIINNFHYPTVMDVDLSFNVIHDQGAKALANHFKYTGNVLRYLDLCNCSLKSSDIKILCDVLKIYPNHLEEFYLAGNAITEDGAIDLCAYLSSRTCHLNILDLSWNRIGELGAMEFANAMSQNKSLIKLNLASNGLNDKGGQRFIDSLAYHTSIEEVNVAQNGISDGTCFVVSQVLKNHPSIKKLDLSINPLGEAGARSIFRTILRGLNCFVTMRNCSYAENRQIFNHTYPMVDNPYHLDLSEPYKRAIVQELLLKYLQDPQHCRFENVFYRENPKSSELPIHLIIHNHQACLKNSPGEKWLVPKQGIIRFFFHQEVFVPAIENRVDDKALNILQIIIENGMTDLDKKTWLSLLCQDIFVTTAQAQAMIDRFKSNRTIGTGGLSILDILKSIWKFLLDTENMFDFLYANTEKSERKDLVYAITLKQYKFNWANPTSHWSLNLADKVQRAIMMQIIAINNSEAEYSQKHSGRGDTSQQGNWFNFRNSKFTINRQTTEIIIDKEFLVNLPLNGTIDFDYVSTKRPPAELYQSKRKKGAKGGKSMDFTADASEDEENPNSGRALSARNPPPTGTATPRGGTVGDLGTFSKDADDDYIADEPFELNLPTGKRPKSGLDLLQSASSFTKSRPVSSTNTPKSAGNSEPNSSRIPYHSTTTPSASMFLPRKIKLITDDELYIFMQQLGLSNRSKIKGSSALFILMDLQLASTKYYFTVNNVLLICDAFQDDWEIQSRVIVALFSRIKDLQNLDLLLRNLDIRGQQDIIKRLGYLNVMNPLKISFDYVLSLKYLDNRIILIALMELAAIESADQIAEEPNTELPIATLYGSYTRALNDVRPEVMRFSYADFGIRTNNISWSTRREYIKKFLVGTHPIDEEMFQIINMFKELESNNALTRGPIDLQYANYLKSQKSNQTRVMKATKAMQNTMRSFAKELKTPK